MNYDEAKRNIEGVRPDPFEPFYPFADAARQILATTRYRPRRVTKQIARKQRRALSSPTAGRLGA